MPKQAKKILQETPLKDPTNNDNPDDYIQDLLDQLGESQATLQLYRTNDEGKFCYVDDLDPDNFSLKTIKDVYGGGRYKITILDSTHRFKGRSKDFYVEGKIKKEDITDFGFEDQDLSIPELNILRQEVHDLKNIVTTLLTHGNINQHTKDNEDIFLDKLLKYKQLFGQNNTNLTDNLEVLTGVFTKSLEFANRLNGPTEETPFTLLRDFLPTVTDLISNYMENKKLDQINKLPSDQKVDIKKLNDVIITGIKGFLSHILNTNKKPDETAKFIINKSSSIEKTKIKEIITKDNPVKYLCKLINDDKETTKIYLTKLVELLRKDLK